MRNNMKQPFSPFFFLVFVLGMFLYTSTDSYAQILQLPDFKELYVNDYAELIPPEKEQSIRQQILQLKNTNGIELSVLTIKKVSDYGPSSSVDYFATQLFNNWKIGDSLKNNGVLIVVSELDRKMRIELGAGYSSAWDTKMKSIIDGVFIPQFKSGRYDQGILMGVNRVINTLRNPSSINNAPTSKSPTNNYREETTTAQKGPWYSRIPKLLYTIFVLPFVFLGTWLYRRRPRNCSVCTNKMEKLPEDRDDEHLEGGQVLEEYLKSVDYDVWLCTYCDHLEINRYKRWFNKHSNCDNCGFRTLITTKTVVQHATKYSTGTRRLDYNCKNCGHTDYELRTIPVIADTTSSGSSFGSSSSSSSSFGGGSSSGGGASGSW